MVELQANDRTVRVLDGFDVHPPPDRCFDLQFLTELPRQCGPGVLTGLDLAAGELPFERVAPPGFALADQDAPVPLDYRGYNFHSAIIEARNAYGAPARSFSESPQCGRTRAAGGGGRRHESGLRRYVAALGSV